MMNKHAILGILLVGTTVLFGGCDLFDGDEDESDAGKSVVVTNGGNFGDQNGSLTFYDAETGATTGFGDLGAFAQGVVLRDGKAYVVLNTFTVGRVDVVDLDDGSVVQQIDVPAPRSVVFLDDETFLATNLSVFGAAGPEPGIVSSISLTTGVVEPFATVGLYPEGIAVVGGTAFVANSGNLGDGTTLSAVDVSSGAGELIELGCDGPNEVFVDDEDELVVVCAGKTVYNEDFTQIIEETNGQVVFVNPSSGQVVSRIELDLKPISASEAQTAFYSDTSEELFVIADPTDEILRFDTSRNALVGRIDVPDATGFTGLAAVAYDHDAERLYVARLAEGAGGFPDFTASGLVLILDRSGDEVDRYTVGPAPTHIAIVD